MSKRAEFSTTNCWNIKSSLIDSLYNTPRHVCAMFSPSKLGVEKRSEEEENRGKGNIRDSTAIFSRIPGLAPEPFTRRLDSCAFTTEYVHVLYSVPAFFSSGGTHDLNLAVRQFFLNLWRALLQKKLPSVLPFVNKNYIIVQLWFGPEKFETTSRPLGITCSDYACHLILPQFWRNCRVNSHCCTVNRPLSYWFNCL